MENKRYIASTIEQAEAALQATFESYLKSPEVQKVLRIPDPDRYFPIVELQEDGRKKRRTASSDNWSPESGEIVIYFGKRDAGSLSSDPIPHPPALPQPEQAAKTHFERTETGDVAQLCEALSEAERAGRSFIALKWFRDDYLVSRNFAWAQTAEKRQAVLSKAIETGAVVTGRIPNPKAPMYPTTTIRLNRQHNSAPESSSLPRYRPVAVRGEPASATLLRDRGAR